MTSRERIKKIISGQEADRCGLWMGDPHKDSWPIWHEYFGTTTEEEVRQKLGDDFRWFIAGAYKHPQGKPMLDMGHRESLSAAGPLANCESVQEVHDFPWPDAKYIDFQGTIEKLEQIGDFYRASGTWTCFYHVLQDLFGMENYLVKMYTHPDVIHAATDRLCQFYYDANERFFIEAGDKVDAFFFGNDFGTQLDLICSPEKFDEFIMPWFTKFTQQGHRHGLQVILHSCGAIHKVIDRLIAADVDCLHPLQAKAKNMDADTLAHDFSGKIAFMGGIDTQDLLLNGSPEEVAAEVHRVRELLGPNLIVSPSHEAVLPNVPPANIEAMAKAALA